MANIPNTLSSLVADKYSISNNTFSFKPKDDPKDLIQVEILI